MRSAPKITKKICSEKLLVFKRSNFLISKKNIFAAKSDTGKRTGPQVPNNHEEPCQKIRHSGGTKIETKKPVRRMKGKYKEVRQTQC